MLIRGQLPDTLSMLYLQLIVGLGYPSARQLSVTLSPFIALISFSGIWVNFGVTIPHQVSIEIFHWSVIWM